MLKKAIFYSMLFVSNLCFGANEEVTVTGVGISESTKTIYIKVSPNLTQGDCSDKSQVRISMVNSFIYREVYSAALMAITTSKKVTMGYDSTSSGACLYNSPVVATFYINK